MLSDVNTAPKVMPTLLALCALTLNGCASKPNQGGIIIDKKGVDMYAYRQDLRECQTYANEVDVGTKVAKSAGTAAVVGGAIGAIFGNSHTAARSAVAGTAKGVSAANREQEQVVKRCLRGRGYHILN
jgi:hypothetical protein